jgi:hypothetical protein
MLSKVAPTLGRGLKLDETDVIGAPAKSISPAMMTCPAPEATTV